MNFSERQLPNALFAFIILLMGSQAMFVLLAMLAGLVYGIKKAKSEESRKSKFAYVLVMPLAAYALASLFIGLLLPPE